MKINILYILILLFSFSLSAQELNKSKGSDIIYLNNGSIYIGTIVAFEQGTELRLQLNNEDKTVLVFKAREIKKVVQPIPKDLLIQTEHLRRKPYEFKEKGFYNHSSISTLSGLQGWNSFTIGASLTHTLGYSWSRWVNVGIGTGVDLYNPNTFEYFVPIFAEFRSYLVAKNISPYINLAAGYGIAPKTSVVREANGGYTLRPSIGYRLGGSSGANLTFDIGYTLQKAQYLRGFVDTWQGERNETKLYRRIAVKMGILF